MIAVNLETSPKIQSRGIIVRFKENRLPTKSLILLPDRQEECNSVQFVSTYANDLLRFCFRRHHHHHYQMYFPLLFPDYTGNVLFHYCAINIVSIKAALMNLHYQFKNHLWLSRLPHRLRPMEQQTSSNAQTLGQVSRIIRTLL